MKKLSTKALSVQLSAVILVSLIVLSVYSIVNTYNKHIDTSQEFVLEKLHGITTTLVAGIDWQEHEYLTATYPNKDDIKTCEQDLLYKDLHKYINVTQKMNNIPTDIYTLFFEEDKCYFGLTSGEKPYWRHEYASHPKEIREHYETGATIGPYEDDHGIWLSSFVPILDHTGKPVAILQADVQFDTFIGEARDEMVANILWSVVIFVVISFFVLFIVRKLAKLDEEKNQRLLEAYAELKVITKDLQDSINYAQRIQWALLPKVSEINEHLPEAFMFYEPKDVVSGDFPWFFKKDHLLYLAAVDCTGHGVPGAMMSVIGHLLMNDIANDDYECTPGELLTKLHQAVVQTLKPNDEEGISDGMDVAVCRIDLNSNEVMYAGAHRPLYLLRNKEVQQFKGNNFPIGSSHYKKRGDYADHTIQIEKDDEIYFFSDGLPDQFGGDCYKKFGPKRIRNIIMEKENFSNMEQTFRQSYLDWKEDCRQVDDILLIGIKF